MTIKEALIWGQKILDPQEKYLNSQADSERLLEFVLQIDKTQLYLNLETSLSFWQKIKYQKLIKKRSRLYPLAYLIGEVGFYNLTLKIKPGVFIPRPESELLVDELLKIINKAEASVRVAEIGVGSGAIALSLLKNSEQKISAYYANDLSFRARRCTKHNARILNLANKIKVIAGRDLKPLLPYHAEILIANPPYVPYQKYQQSPSIQAEPWRAITDKNDGLDFFRRLVTDLQEANYYPQIIALEFDEDTTTTLLKILAPLFAHYTYQVHQDWQQLDRFIILQKI